MFERKYQPENSLQIKGIMSNTRMSYKNLHLYARYTFLSSFFRFVLLLVLLLWILHISAINIRSLNRANSIIKL